MGKTAFIFPGQGAQKAGMGKDFYENSQTAREIYEEAGRLLGLDMASLCFEPNDQLDLTEYTQAAMVTTSLAMLAVLQERGLKAHVTAGLSLGEYCALTAAGAMNWKDAVALVRRRGILMQNAVPAGEGAMAAVLMLSADKIEEVLEAVNAQNTDTESAGSTAGKGISIANYNCPGQIVISGYTPLVEAASEKLKEAGAKRVIPLNVSGPFHSPLLQEAGEELRQVLEPISLSELQIPYVTNVTAEYITDTARIKELLVRQVSSSVRWQQSVEAMLVDGVDTFIEIGPGKTLTGFVKKINRKVNLVNIETWEDMENYLEKV